MTHQLTELVENAARVRKDPVVPREFIETALARIEDGLEEVERYSTDKPSPKGVYEIATRLQAEKTTKQ
ncbi:hypothetical protein HKL94_01075 [Candidatus Parcubacteria bacterium]|nr:hypothetical protein [Candidatus Parcubacteria bacterium]